MENEPKKPTVNDLSEFAHKTVKLLDLEGLGLSSEMEAEIVGQGMAMYDALIAIRDGQSWRGFTDPREIATEILRPTGL